MRKAWLMALLCGACMCGVGVFVASSAEGQANDRRGAVETATVYQRPERMPVEAGGFDVQVLVNGRPLEEYDARGRRYVEAQKGVEYELRIRNPLPQRVAVALSVDGLNTIDARRTTRWEASKWVIEPYQTITISGWQMSSARARRFYFTTERDSYAAKLGRPTDVGVISAVFFRERRPVTIIPRPYPREEPYDNAQKESKSDGSATSSEAPAAGASRARNQPQREIAPVPDDYAATGIGRSVRHDVRHVNLDLEPSPAAEVMIRYEYHAALVRLGIRPQHPSPDPLQRRERARGFEDQRFCPEP